MLKKSIMYQRENTSVLQFKELFTNKTEVRPFNLVEASPRSSCTHGLVNFNCRSNYFVAILSFWSDVRKTSMQPCCCSLALP